MSKLRTFALILTSMETIKGNEPWQEYMQHDQICLCCGEGNGEGETNEHNERQWYVNALVWVRDIDYLND